MSETERNILDTFAKTIPMLSELEQEKLLSFSRSLRSRLNASCTCGSA